MVGKCKSWRATFGTNVGKRVNDEVLSIIIGLLLIVCVSIYDYSSVQSIFVIDDTFGYWGNAAIIAGKPWGTAMANMPYYGIGYSLFLLPILLIFNTSESMYHCAIIINVLFLMGSYLCAIYSGKRFFPKVSGAHIAMAALAAVLIPSRIIYTRITLTENVLNFMVWIGITLLQKFEERGGKHGYFFLILVHCFFCCLIHARTLPLILFEGVIIATYSYFRGNKRKSIAILFIWGIMIVLYFFVKKQHTSLLYSNSERSTINNISSGGIIHQISEAVFNNTTLLGKSLLSKIIVAIMMSYMMLPIIFSKTIQQMYNTLRKKQNCSYLLVRVYLIFGFVIMIFLTAIQAKGYYRGDSPVYSRYFDFMIEPIILLGLVELLEDYQRNRLIFMLTGVLSIFLILFPFFEMTKCEQAFSGMASPFIGGVLELSQSIMGLEHRFTSWLGIYDNNAYIVGGLIIQSLFLLIMVSMDKMCKWVNKGRTYLAITGLILLLSTGVGLAQNIKYDEIRQSTYYGTREICDMINSDSRDVYYVDQWDGAVGTAEYVQFELMDREMKVITLNDLDAIRSEAWILSGEKMEITKYRNRCEYIKTKNGMHLYAYHTNDFISADRMLTNSNQIVKKTKD